MDVFVYGTLTDPAQAEAVLDSVRYRGRAELDGLHCVDGEYPTLAPGGSVPGRILETDDVAGLDRYEGVDRGLYVRISVPVADEDVVAEATDPTVETYVGDSDALDASVEWPGEGSFRASVDAYLATNDVVVRDPDDAGTFDDFAGYDGDAATDAVADHDAWGVE